MIGKRIDAAHPAAQKYLEKHAPDPTKTPAADDMAVALAFCQANNIWSARAVMKGTDLSDRRARAAMTRIRDAGLIPSDAVTAKPPGVKLSGQAGRKDQKKRESLARLKAKAAGEETKPSEGLVEIPEDIRIFLDFTLREIYDKFGTETAFNDWLAATAKIETINERRLKNAKSEGELISRALVKTNILDRIDGMFVRMLTDGAKTIASRGAALIKAGKSESDLQKLVQDQLNSQIEPTKDRIARALRNA